MLLQSFCAPSRRYGRGYREDPFTALQRAFYGDHEATAGTEVAALRIPLDVKEDEKAYHVNADLPGLAESEVEVTFDDGLLTIRGEKKVERDEKKDTWHITERSYGSFARQLSLPAGIDAGKIEAKFDKGVLSVTLPKLAPEQTTSKKINIKVG